MTLTDMQATVTIGGNSMSGKVVSVVREHSLDKVGQAFTINLDASVSGLDPWDDVVIAESGQDVLTGYVSSVVRERPGAQVQVTGMDTWKRALDYFLEGNLYTNGETVAYWIDYLCGQCGLSYSLASSGGDLSVGVDVPLGLRPVSEALFTVAARAQWNIRVLADGTVEFVALVLGEAEHDFGAVIEGEYEVGDRETRNVAKVWGWDEQPESPGGSMLHQETRSVEGVDQERIMVFANPMIDTADEAFEMATAALNHFASLDRITRLRDLGSPDYQVGDVGAAEILPGSPHTQFITDLRSTVDEKGYATDITLGRKTFLLPFFDTVEGETGEPSEPVEETPVLGRAHSIWGQGLYMYVGGYEIHASGSHIYRLEKRVAASGSLIWAVNGHWDTPTPQDEIRGVWADDSNVYVIGHAGTILGPLVSASFSVVDGSENWQTIYSPLTTGSSLHTSYRLRGDSTGLYALLEDFFWLGTDSTQVMAKLSKVDGSILWVAEPEIDRDDSPAPPNPNTVVRFFTFDLDVSAQETYILVVGSVGNGTNNIATPAARLGLRAHYNKTTGAIETWTTLDGNVEDASSGTAGVLQIGQYDRYVSNQSWGGGRRPTNTQQLYRQTGLVTAGSLSGPDNSVNTRTMDIAGGVTYTYSTWQTGVPTSKIRAVTKGTVVQQWLLELPSGTLLWGLAFYRAGALLWGCGQKDGFFYSAYRSV